MPSRWLLTQLHAASSATEVELGLGQERRGPDAAVHADEQALVAVANRIVKSASARSNQTADSTKLPPACRLTPRAVAAMPFIAASANESA